jgi:ribosomal protein L28
MPSSDQIRAKLGLGPRPKPLFGHNRSHALNATQKISKPNLQNKWVVIGGQRYRVKLTAREMRTLDKKGISLSSVE